MPDTSNRKVGRWTLGTPLGKASGQGRVYEGKGGEGEEVIAIKIVRAGYLKKRSRLEREILVHSQLSEAKASNIMPVLDHGVAEIERGGIEAFIAMPKAWGSLEDGVETTRSRLELALEIGKGVATGLKHAHE